MKTKENNTTTPLPDAAALFRPGQVWLDEDGQPIQSHLGGVLYEDGTHYWHGMNMDGQTLLPGTHPNQYFSWMVNRGMTCYSSTDLKNWKLRSVSVLPVEDDPSHPLQPLHWMIRPKVLRCPATGDYVMMAQLAAVSFATTPDGLNAIVVATGKTPYGPFEYHGVLHPPGNAYDTTMYQDDDGTGYLITSHGWVKAHRLSRDYLSIEQTFELSGVAGEAPAIFKHEGHYYFLTSQLTGWASNPNEYSVASSFLGPYTPKGTFATGPGAGDTFAGQTTFVLPVAGRSGAFIWMGDRMNAVTDSRIEDLSHATHLWLPITLDSDRQTIEVPWREEWDLSVFDDAAQVEK